MRTGRVTTSLFPPLPGTRTPERDDTRRLRDELAAMAARLELLEEENRRLREPISAVAIVGRRLGLTPRQAEMLGALMLSARVSRQSVCTALYGLLDEAPCPKTFDVMLHHMRPKLAVAGITVETIPAYGWALPADSRARILALIDEVSA